jgi:hypothetical protein
MRAIRSNNSPSCRRRNSAGARGRTRREFIRDIAAYGAATLAAGTLGDIVAAQNGWQSRAGLELYTVRDLMATDFEGVLAKAKVSYRNLARILS